ncbi:Hypothetical protein CAP_6907 [Chondromyces apiculatus DSM 436]|uniref:Uncharacterized protein n=1 Tax=Chondromyces apiculatus DSM 436 TaxID=1192034 RepID=A0A017TGD7_9BACT|nr:Hypothetical protein CAP_6907 [Chondromyces apiculatus DSM 436]
MPSRLIFTPGLAVLENYSSDEACALPLDVKLPCSNSPNKRNQ